ncbi:MAG: FliA/WhiG family RNA polymerase sigma factor [Deltaproteobacteria bacterium]|nr:FliA/WhiG family RNA polymerase sigma factor [Deltaproteobacteria bacterium]
MKAELIKSRQDPYPPEEPLNNKMREEQMLQHAPLIHYIANRLAKKLPPLVSKEELVSAGVIGLMDAADKFDTSLSINFKTYAEHRIRGAMLDELRKTDWFPRSLRKNIRRVEKAVLALEKRLGRKPEDQEIAEELGLDLEEYFRIIHRNASVGFLNIDELISDGDLKHVCRDSETHSFPDDLKVEEMKKVVADALKGLPDIEQKVLSLYYYDELTLKEIGEILHLSESRISQVRSKGILRLKKKLQCYHES